MDYRDNRLPYHKGGQFCAPIRGQFSMPIDSLIPALRQISATGVPSSHCLMTNAFCASVNFEAFMP
jgi:hypothetical protein